jgi:protein-L-isoaspartate(D-aspartate) O-methyltransferase
MAGFPDADPWQLSRLAMVATQLRNRGIRDERVLAAMERVPRHAFVPANMLQHAYEDQPVVIEEEQTISQPYIVAAMLEAVHLRPEDVVLEVGTGSGYQTALLAELAARVYSVERYAVLADLAEQRLRKLGYSNIEVAVGDGTLGLSQHAPYDVIVVAAAAPRVPAALLQQLREGDGHADGGRLIIPVGTPENQQLQLVRRRQGQLVTSFLDGCRFVPLIGEEGFHV